MKKEELLLKIKTFANTYEEDIEEHFGTWDKALDEAGIPIEKIFMAKEEVMIYSLKKFYNEYKDDISEAKYRTFTNHPSGSSICRYFGSWNNALKCAGIPVNNKYRAPRNMSDEDVIEIIKKAKSEIKGTFNTTTYDKWARENDQIVLRTLTRKYVTWENIKKMSGIYD